MDNVQIEKGTSYTMEVHEGVLIGRYGTSVVLRAKNVSPELLQAVRDSYGVAKGTVEEVHDVAGVVELFLC
ncbi:MAG: hypothetical protein FJZ01_16040 [Candidatus Sericytochromatia bacterium]|nr:hypothetical protein [Candidatus Tanganyikabacteria bacterium]